MKRPSTIRRAGYPWRLLVHEYVGRQADGTCYGNAHDVEPGPDSGKPSRWRVHHELPGNCEFDEVVVGQWLHVEGLARNLFYVNIAGLLIDVTVDDDGRATSVFVRGVEDPAAGCTYEGVD